MDSIFEPNMNNLYNLTNRNNNEYDICEINALDIKGLCYGENSLRTFPNLNDTFNGENLAMSMPSWNNKEVDRINSLYAQEIKYRSYHNNLINQLSSNLYMQQLKSSLLLTTNNILKEGIQLIEDNNLNEFDKLPVMHLKEKDSDNLTLLKAAILLNKIDFVNLILKKLENNYGDENLLALCCEYNNTIIINKILDISDELDIPGGSMDEVPLYYVIMNKNEHIFKLLTSNDKVDINKNFKNGMNVLTLCLQLRNITFIELLLTHPKINLTINNYFILMGLGESLGMILPKILKNDKIMIENINQFFMECVKSNFISDDIISTLINHVDINYQDDQGDTALMWAYNNLYFGKLNIILQSKKLNLALHNKNDMNILMQTIEKYNNYYFDLIINYLAANSDNEVIKEIINQKNNSGENCILISSQKNAENGTIKKLIDLGVDLNVQNNLGQTPLILCIVNQRKEDIECLLKNDKLDVNLSDYEGKTPLMYAIDYLIQNEETFMNDKLSILYKLLNHKNIDINKKNNLGHNVLLYLLMKKYKKDSIISIKKDIEPYEPNILNKYPKNIHYSPLSIENNKPINYEMLITMLIKKGGDFNIVDNFNYNALFYAYQNEDINVFNILMNNKINLNHKNNNGETLLTKIINEGKLSANGIYMSDRLITNELTEINSQDYHGNTALHCSVKKNNYFTTIKLLESKKININTQNYEGNTALMECIQNNYWNLAELLIKNQININIKNNYGMGIMDIASKNGTINILNNIIEKYSNKKKGWFN